MKDIITKQLTFTLQIELLLFTTYISLDQDVKIFKNSIALICTYFILTHPVLRFN